MSIEVLKMRPLVAQLGAILAAFVLAFSLVSLTVPARADDAQTMKVWVEYKFAGDTVTLSEKVHSTVQGADHKTFCSKSEFSTDGTSQLGYITAKSEITQYEGVEVCAIEVTAPLETVLNYSSSDLGISDVNFNIERDGSNVRIEGETTRYGVSSYGNDWMDFRLTFAGGIVSAEGVEVSGNTAKLKPGEKYKVVGNPGSGSSNNGGSFPSASSDASSLGAATSSPSVAASDAIKPQETTSNAAAAGASATSSAVTTSAVGSTDSSNDTIIYGAVVAVAVLALGGLGWAILQSRKKA
ncbi:MAG: hypothetical protein KH147_05135 [Actinomyces graevenitzii]|jgi:hypothetical protein|uniref:hypothetical protein n=1 Tax=Actinomyces graevenitzii TaxID=55565 RepID=UPI000C7FCE52|nr:hypothetical protein [Actinomyces graevenitzii]MBS6934585.1 hypothetical protein [Actinomyces graevenitzii]PMC92544.1 hypothetical protein CJ186_03435 [Actinomyces graevenitzii]